MEYYTHGRGELTHRRITPISLEAETYLHAYCHMRRDDRVFRISRIAELHPTEEDCPWDLDEAESDDGEAASDGEEGKDDGQMSLL
jgi:predicted DNA-binding transcriptional regulator YafY